MQSHILPHYRTNSTINLENCYQGGSIGLPFFVYNSVRLIKAIVCRTGIDSKGIFLGGCTTPFVVNLENLDYEWSWRTRLWLLSWLIQLVDHWNSLNGGNTCTGGQLPGVLQLLLGVLWIEIKFDIKRNYTVSWAALTVALFKAYLQTMS